MRVPRDVYGRDFADHLIRRWDFIELRQTGSHIILRTGVPFPLTVSLPAHKPMRVGTLSGLFDEIARHRNTTPESILMKYESDKANGSVKCREASMFVWLRSLALHVRFTKAVFGSIGL